MQADENGEVYLTHFMAYDYGMFSKDDSNVSIASDSSTADLQKMQAIQSTYGDGVSIDRIYWTKNDAGVAVQKALITVRQGNAYTMQVVDL